MLRWLNWARVMPRHVFFSFEYEHDVTRAMVVRKSWVTQGRLAAGFFDSADVEQARKLDPSTIRRWIAEQMQGTSVTVVLVGSHTCKSEWVRHEIELSEERGNGLLGIDISKIKDLNGTTSHRCGRIPRGYPFYFWNRDQGFRNLGSWIETAASVAGR